MEYAPPLGDTGIVADGGYVRYPHTIQPAETLQTRTLSVPGHQGTRENSYDL